MSVENLRPDEELSRESFSDRILDYFENHGRGFPWRQTDNLLHAMVAEIMLQQTSYYQVEPKYNEFTAEFRDPEEVLDATDEQLKTFFEGLGLANRIEYVKAAAKYLSETEEVTQEGLLGVKGVGRYTANAVMSIHLGKRFPIVDGNVARVFEKHFDIDDDSPPSQNDEIWELAWELLPEENVKEYNLGLIDYGAKLYGKNPD